MTTKTIYILFHEQAVCEKGYKIEKTYLVRVVKIVMLLYHSLLGVRDNVSIVEKTDEKGSRVSFCYRHLATNKARIEQTDYQREIIINCIPTPR